MNLLRVVWPRWVRPALNWRVGLLTLGLVFAIEYGVSNRYWYKSDGYRRVDRWTGQIEQLDWEYDPRDVYKTGAATQRWTKIERKGSR